ncbi:enoyl-CoA hydratase/isomerase family protein [Kribbia dieselivorans]|uniref:enoyl-CoA hydratase/isomerase family protein n=1 Tax=Kribbia dieselivorans TaxID=331526 RepID=UPI000A6FF9FA|nr:enoyl-CoA hydratase-related protein [Kribbia dieselivorans]
MTTPEGLENLETLLVDVADGVALITVNRPDVRNALSEAVLADLRTALTALRGDDTVGAVVFTGSGEKAFIAGADIAEVRTYDLTTGLTGEMQRTMDLIESFEKPTIAAINGFALGGGCELAMACDLRIASDNARFGLPEANLAVLPGAGGTQRMTRLIGVGRTLDLILTGRLVGAAQAEQYGLVTEVVEPDALLPRARELAMTIMAKGPLAVRLAKLVVRAGFDAAQPTGQVIELLAQTVLYGTADKAEGTEAFLGKRTAEFQGH